MTKREKDIFMKMVNLMYAMKRMGDHKAEIDFENYHIKFEFKEFKPKFTLREKNNE